jgi:hypothetical protein
MIRRSAQIASPLLRPSDQDHAATKASPGGEPKTRSVEQQRDRATRLDAVPLRFLRFNAVRDRTGLSGGWNGPGGFPSTGASPQMPSAGSNGMLTTGWRRA